jgi:hypothetical protein
MSLPHGPGPGNPEPTLAREAVLHGAVVTAALCGPLALANWAAQSRPHPTLGRRGRLVLVADPRVSRRRRLEGSGQSARAPPPQRRCGSRRRLPGGPGLGPGDRRSVGQHRPGHGGGRGLSRRVDGHLRHDRCGAGPPPHLRVAGSNQPHAQENHDERSDHRRRHQLDPGGPSQSRRFAQRRAAGAGIAPNPGARPGGV